MESSHWQEVVKNANDGRNFHTRKGGSMTFRDLFLALALVALLALGVAITSGAFGGPSDIETRIRASEPLSLQK
jgi:hypothetical protein